MKLLLRTKYLQLALVLAALLLFSSVSFAEQQAADIVVHFKPGSSTLSGNELQRLLDFAKQLDEKRIKLILVDGHCDYRPTKKTSSYDDNLELSQARAYNVFRTLQQTSGLPPSYFKNTGYSTTRLAVQGQTKKAHTANRRTEVTVIRTEKDRVKDETKPGMKFY